MNRGKEAEEKEDGGGTEEMKLNKEKMEKTKMEGKKMDGKKEEEKEGTKLEEEKTLPGCRF